MKNIINTGIGFGIYESEPNRHYITGYPDYKKLGHSYDSVYDFEDAVQRLVDCSGINFDSESCQFWAYSTTSERLVKFADDIKAHFEKAQNLIKEMY
jgi:hypothetical protein